MTDAATMTMSCETRTFVLGPTIRQLVQVMRARADQQGILALAVKQYTVEVGAWERSVILEGYNAGTPASIDLAYRLAEAVAVQARGLNDLVRLTGEPQPSDEQHACTREDLVLDYAMGTAIHTELTLAADDLAASGHRGQARNLGDVLGRLDRTLHILREQLRENELNTASLMVDELRTQAEGRPSGSPSRGEIPESPAPGHWTPEPKTRQRRGMSGRLASSGKQIAVVGVLTALVVVGGILLWPTLMEKRDLGYGLRFVPGIESYRGAPPALTVRVSPTHWAALDRSGRTAWVWGVVAAASRSGYTKCEFLDTDGATVAKWAKGGRVSVF